MKLRNKRTGEIGKPAFIGVDYEITILPEDKNKKARYYKTLAELNKEWEDVPEEPKNPYFINWFGEVSELSGYISDKEIKRLKEIGNYFGTKEEAEAAVERLRAWKRLKDKGFRFRGWIRVHKKGSADITIASFIDEDYDITNDLDICFGGEE